MELFHCIYAVFGIRVYVYIGSPTAPSVIFLPPVWAKITLVAGMTNFLVYVLACDAGCPFIVLISFASMPRGYSSFICFSFDIAGASTRT